MCTPLSSCMWWFTPHDFWNSVNQVDGNKKGTVWGYYRFFVKHPTMGQVREVRGAKHTGGTTAFSFLCVCVWANRGQSCQKTAYQLDEKQWGEVKLTPFKPYDWFELFIHSASVFQSSKGRCQRGREEGVQKGCDNQGSLWIWNKFGFLCKIWPLLAALFDKSNTSLRYLTGIKINNRVFQVLDI